MFGLLVVSGGCIGNIGSGSGTVNLYASDQPAALEAFQSLEVTVDQVMLEQEVEGETEVVVRDLDEPRTFDLTQLVGDNATKITTFDAPNDTYSSISLRVTNTNGTLESGEQTEVMLPNNTLKLQQEFTVDEDEEVNFVYDMNVVKAGQSGKFVIQPVVTESGVNQPISPVDTDEGEGDISVRFDAPPEQGENATVRVTDNGEPVEGATVTVNGEAVGTTDANGTLTFEVSQDEELEVSVEDGDTEAEAEVEVNLSAESNTEIDVGSESENGTDNNSSTEEESPV